MAASHPGTTQRSPSASSPQPTPSWVALSSARALTRSASRASTRPSKPCSSRSFYQQLHGKAAAAILKPLTSSELHPSPEHLIAAPDDRLRGCGPSATRPSPCATLPPRPSTEPCPRSLRSPALGRSDHRAPHPGRGIGPWTVEMLLIFRLGRPDVLPVTDYGVRKGFASPSSACPSRSRSTRPCSPRPRRCSAGLRCRPCGRWPAGISGAPATSPAKPRRLRIRQGILRSVVRAGANDSKVEAHGSIYALEIASNSDRSTFDPEEIR